MIHNHTNGRYVTKISTYKFLHVSLCTTIRVRTFIVIKPNIVRKQHVATLHFLNK